MRARFRLLGVIVLPTLLSAGCSSAAPDREIRMTRGYIYYLDGAGGGTPLSNWAGGVRKGLLDAGYYGAGEMFTWQTGLGVGVDQLASVAYKRSKARELASRITNYKTAHPNAPVHLIGLSAGTAIIAFTLEALPPNVQVQNVVMLSGSLSASYDLTSGLRRVRNKMYVFTSDRDAVLKFLLPLGGTADRASGTVATIGLTGVKMAGMASTETRRQYAKIVHVPWSEDFARLGHHGGHTDSVRAPFVRKVVAPLVMASSAPSAPASPGLVANPDYERWSRFPAGSWVLIEGYQAIGGMRQPVRVRATLLSKDASKLQIKREWFSVDSQIDEPLQSKRFFVMASVDPSDHPATDRASQVGELQRRVFSVNAAKLQCEGRSIAARGNFADWGTDVSGSVFTHRTIPGGLVWVDVSTTLKGRAVRFVGQVVDYFVAGT